jgi:integrase
MPRITKSVVDAAKPADSEFTVWDSELKGFGLRVRPTGARSYVVVYRLPGEGRRGAVKRVTVGAPGKITPDQARQAAKKLLGSVAHGQDPAADRAERRNAVTVAELLDLFDQQYVATMVKPSTAVSHRIAMAELRRAHGGMKAESLTRAHIATLHARMSDRPYAANRAVAVWGKVFTWGASRGLISDGTNPTKGLQKYREQGRERFLTREELSRLGDTLRIAETEGLPYTVDETKPKAKHAPKPDNRLVKLDPFAVAAIRLLILTGARLREILHAQWSQVDLERGVIFLADSKTGKKPIYLSAAARELLASLPRIEGNPYVIAGHGPRKKRKGAAAGQDASPAPENSGPAGAPRADLNKPWAAVKRAAGLDGVRLHDLRHSFASFGAGASLGLPIIGKLLGHTQAATTQRYAHLDADPLRRAVDTIGATIAAAMEGKAGATVIDLPKGKNG